MRKAFLFCIIMVLFPYVATLAFAGTIRGHEERTLGETGMSSGKRIYLDRQRRGYVDAEEYLVGVVAKQMPADYEEEALKAQAVIARTYIYRQMEGRDEIAESELAMEYLEEEQMEKLWGKPRFLEYYQKIRQAVEETRGKVMVAQEEYVEPLFHRASAGQTRDGDEAHPYLVSVDSREDMEAEGYLTAVIWTKEQFTACIRTMDQGEGIKEDQIPDSIQVVGRDNAGYVTEIQIGSHTFDGESVRKALELPSAAYALEGYGEGVRAVCRGEGHGYGMSQYGAHKKAAAGMKADEILRYYYNSIEIISLEE